MSEPFSFEIKGLDALQKKLQEELPKDAKKALRIALSAGAGDVKRAIQDEAPVEEGGENSGFLKDHNKTKIVLRRNELAGTAFVGPTNDVYRGREGKEGQVTVRTRTGKLVTFMSKHAGQTTAAMVGRFLEFGTRKMSKHAWMTPAWESSKQKALDHIVAKLKETLKLS